MSVVLDNGVDYYERNEVIDPDTTSWTMAGWFRWDTDSGAANFFGLSTATFSNSFLLNLATDNDVATFHGSGGFGPSDVFTAATATWYYVVLQWDAADNSLRGMYLADGDSTFQGDVLDEGLGDLDPTDLVIGVGTNDGNDLFPGTIAFVKIWASIVSDANLLTERQYRNVQTGSAWALYKFLTGALTADSSGNSRTLTSNGEPAFSSDEPDAILGDDPAGESAALTGTLSDNATEAEIVAGGETLIITLTNDTWVATGATFNGQRQAIIDGMDSAQSEATGWNAEVRDKEGVTAVVRTSDTVVTITLSAAAAYDITAQETITMTVPASALVTSASPLTATPTFDITPDASAAVVIIRRRYQGA